MDFIRTGDEQQDRDQIPSNLEGTCQWIFGNPHFENWAEGRGPPILFLVGSAGQGKSVLAKHVVETFQTIGTGSNCAMVLSYFCKDSPNRNTASGIMQSILYQLLRNRPALFRNVPEKHLKSPTTVMDLSFESLWATFISILRHPDLGTVRVVIDGIDECTEDSQSQFFHALERSFSGSCSDVIPSDHAVGILIVSRATALAVEYGKGFSMIEIQLADVSQDIARFIKTELDKLTVKDVLQVEQAPSIGKDLEEGADGMFLWVSLVLEELNQPDHLGSKKALRKTIQGLPRTLDGFFARHLERIPQKKRDSANRILGILLTNQQALSLDNFSVLFVDWPDECPTLSQLEDERTPAHCIERVTKSICGPLIKIAGNTIDLVHHSARQFLISSESIYSGPLSYFRYTATKSSLRLATICLQYLLLEDSWLGVHDTMSEKSRFSNYANLQLHRFIRLSKDKISTCVPMLKLFFDLSRDHYASWLTLLGSCAEKGMLDLGAPMSTQPLHIIIQCHMSNLLPYCRLGKQCNSVEELDSQHDELILTVPDLEIRNGSGSTALLFAALFGDDEELVRDPASETKAHDTSISGITLLPCTDKTARCTSVEYLLEAGANVNTSDDQGRSPMMVAAMYGRVGIMQQFIQFEAEINSADLGGMTALHYACAQGELAAVTELLRHGADVNCMENTAHASPLYLAVIQGHLDIVMQLIHYGAEVRCHTCDHTTSLHAAAYGGNIKIAKELIIRQVSVADTRDGGATPLHIAAEEGHVEMVVYLISQGASISAQTVLEATPLLRQQ